MAMPSGVRDVPPTHTATHEWQSFEMRMRQRRIDRLLVVAAEAIQAGNQVGAREALDELDVLAPQSETVGELRARLTRPPDPQPIEDIDLRPPVGATSAPEPQKKHAGIAWAAGILLALAGLAWFAGPGMLGPLFEPAARVTSTSAPATGTTGHAAASSNQQVQVDVREVPAPASTAEEPPPAGPEPLIETSDVTPSSESSGDAPVTSPDIRPPSAPATSDLTVAASSPPQVPPVPAAATPRVPLEPAPDLPAPAAAFSASSSSSTGTAIPITAPDTPSPSRAIAGDDASRAVTRDDAGVRASLERYESAYSRLDVEGAAAVFPELDRRALARAFDGLSSQRVNLGSCDVRFVGDAAIAECKGSATWTPKVGGGSHSDRRRWQFRLRNTSGSWQIVSATVNRS
jgi:hypothetical protein